MRMFQEEGLNEVHALMEAESSDMETNLKQVLEELSVSCTKYVTISKSVSTGPGTGKTKLDKEYIKLCQREIVSTKILWQSANLLWLGYLIEYHYTVSDDTNFI